MQYVPFGSLGFQVSRLGFGTMRLPTRQEGENTVIDRPAAIAMIRRGIDGGINYVDTAYPYHHGESEVVVGLALKDGYRDRVKLTTKLPVWALKEEKDMNRLLDEQLKKLDVPCLDFYLLHALNKDRFELLRSFHYQDFCRQAMKDGRVKHIGFSFHDEKPVFMDILHDWDQWGLAQIQFNYLDDGNQATEEGLLEAGRRGVPVVVMEPLRGGALANPPENVRRLIDAHETKRSPVEWAFAYVADYPQVATILSGMSTPEQVEDNLSLFDRLTVGGMTKEDRAFTAALKQAFLSRMPIPCTGCRYCQPCPRQVAIPDLFEAYNQSKMFDQPDRFRRAYQGLESKEQDAGRCVSCGACESACPQHIDIIQWLQAIREEA